MSLIREVAITESVLPDGASTEAKQDDFLTELQKKADLTETQPVSVSQVDSTTGAVNVIKQSHASLHAGEYYSYQSYITIAQNGVGMHLFVTPDTGKWAHVIISIEPLSSDVLVEIYEDTVTTSDGTMGVTINRNRNFSDSNTTLIYESPTVSTDGTKISSFLINAGYTLKDDVEMVLKQNTKYMVKVTEANIAATSVNIRCAWYEHTNI